MKLTEAERLILLNQYRILAAVDAEPERESHRHHVEALDGGFTRYYPSLDTPELTDDAQEFVIETLNLYRALQRAVHALGDDSPVSAKDVRFPGFDGNDEHQHLSFACYLVEDLGRWSEVKLENKDLNSHCWTLRRYETMLSRWRESENQWELSADDVRRILEPVRYSRDGS